MPLYCFPHSVLPDWDPALSLLDPVLQDQDLHYLQAAPCVLESCPSPPPNKSGNLAAEEWQLLPETPYHQIPGPVVTPTGQMA